MCNDDKKIKNDNVIAKKIKMRKGYGVVLIAIFLLIVLIRHKIYFYGTPNTFDLLIVGVLLALLLTPLYSELSIGGITLKREIEMVKEDIDNKIEELQVNIKTEIKTEIDSRIEISPVINIENKQTYYKSMQELREELLDVIDQPLNDFIGEKDIYELPSNIDSKTLFMFASRYKIEKLLREIWFQIDEKDSKWPSTAHYIASRLFSENIIGIEAYRYIKDIYNITSPSIHGKNVDIDELALVYSISPKIISTLEVIRDGMTSK